MTSITDRFNNPYRIGNHLVWKLKTNRHQVREISKTSYRVLLPNADWLRNDGGTTKSFRSLEKAMIAAIEHAGG